MSVPETESDEYEDVRSTLTKVRFTENPPWGIKALFVATLKMINLLESQDNELKHLRNRLAKHEARLKLAINDEDEQEAEPVQSSLLVQSKDGVLDVFK